MPLTFITGGCRSGKSAYAQNMAERALGAGHALFLATAYIYDEAMGNRVEQHRTARGPRWRTHDPVPGGEDELYKRLPDLAAGADVVLLDCLTLWVSAAMERYSHAEESGGADTPAALAAFTTDCGQLLDALGALPCPAIVVSNEVGLGVVPSTSAGRVFRDYAGLANQLAAARANTAVFMVSGLPLLLKGQQLP